jgi:hypothetical protein
MAARTVPIEQRIMTPMITNMPLRLRKEIERVPLGEVIRRAVTQYVEKF